MNDNDMNIEAELKENYTQGLIKGYAIAKGSNQRIEGFTIEVLEGNDVDFELGENYCYVDKKSKVVYESFEAILQSISPLYSEKFDQILMSKMNQLNDLNQGV